MLRLRMAIILLCLPCAASQHNNAELSVLISHYYEAKKYSPLPLPDTHPEEIAAFIGTGERIITVDVPTLPFLLSSQFEKVTVVDSSLAQLRLTNSLRAAALATPSSLMQVITTLKNDFIAYNQENINDIQAINIHFSSTYSPIINSIVKDNIEVKFDEIFNIIPNNKSTIFIATLNRSKVDIIKMLIGNGHTIVFISDYETMNALSGSFDSCTINVEASQKSPGLYYIKILNSLRATP